MDIFQYAGEAIVLFMAILLIDIGLEMMDDKDELIEKSGGICLMLAGCLFATTWLHSVTGTF